MDKLHECHELQFLHERQVRLPLKQMPNLTKNYNCSISFQDSQPRKFGKALHKIGLLYGYRNPIIHQLLIDNCILNRSVHFTSSRSASCIVFSIVVKVCTTSFSNVNPLRVCLSAICTSSKNWNYLVVAT